MISVVQNTIIYINNRSHCVLCLYTGRLASDSLVENMNPEVNPICSNVSVTPKKMQQTSNLYEIKLKCKKYV